MATYDAFVVCAPRDWIDLVGIFAPLIPATAAVVAAIYAAKVAKGAGDEAAAAMRASMALQRDMSRPLLATRHAIDGDNARSIWRVEVENRGHSVALVDRFELAIDGQVRPWPIGQNVAEFWTQVLAVVGLVPVQLELFPIRHAPFTIAEGDSITVLSAVVDRHKADVLALRPRLRIRAGYRSTWGDHYSLPPQPAQ